MNRSQRLRQLSLDLDLWQKLYYKHQQDYIRQRLKAIQLLFQGLSRLEVAATIGVTYKTLSQWIDLFLDGGLEQLTRPITHDKPSRLSPEQKQLLKQMVLEQFPTDYGIDKWIWTGEVICQVIDIRWQIELKDSRVYEILSELGLSHQKAHRDYADADPQQQQEFIETVKKKWQSRLRKKR